MFHDLPPITDAPLPARLPVAHAHDGNPPRSAGDHLLYLDDDPALVKLITRLLAKRGFTVTKFTEQTQVLDALRVDPMAFDLLLSDFNMRGLSGVDVAREARAIRAYRPIILVSRFVDEEARRVPWPSA